MFVDFLKGITVLKYFKYLSVMKTHHLNGITESNITTISCTGLNDIFYYLWSIKFVFWEKNMGEYVLSYSRHILLLIFEDDEKPLQFLQRTTQNTGTSEDLLT